MLRVFQLWWLGALSISSMSFKVLCYKCVCMCICTHVCVWCCVHVCVVFPYFLAVEDALHTSCVFSPPVLDVCIPFIGKLGTQIGVPHVLVGNVDCYFGPFSWQSKERCELCRFTYTQMSLCVTISIYIKINKIPYGVSDLNSSYQCLFLPRLLIHNFLSCNGRAGLSVT